MKSSALRNPRIDNPDPNEWLIGTTERSSRGYFIRVVRKFFDNAGYRIRITLLRDNGGVIEHVHHLDVTAGLLAQVIPILQKAVMAP